MIWASKHDVLGNMSSNINCCKESTVAALCPSSCCSIFYFPTSISCKVSVMLLGNLLSVEYTLFSHLRRGLWFPRTSTTVWTSHNFRDQFLQWQTERSLCVQTLHVTTVNNCNCQSRPSVGYDTGDPVPAAWIARGWLGDEMLPRRTNPTPWLRCVMIRGPELQRRTYLSPDNLLSGGIVTLQAA